MIETRPPVVAIMGHIDHGKSTLIDYIRKTNTTTGEAGGITQHISAYEITHKMEDGRSAKITLLDTPGHAAFQGIRRRGASAADIGILVVSAEDGVKPQTLEALERIKESGLPFLVAITKIDKPAADINRTKQNLAENNVFVEGYGGNTPVVAVSAKTGDGIPELLDMIILIADLEGLTGETDLPGNGVIIENELDPKKGIVGVGIVKNGTVRRGMFAGAAGAVAPIRFLFDTEGNTVEELAFSSPIQIIGWDKMPPIGSSFKTFLKKDEAVEYSNLEKDAFIGLAPKHDASSDMLFIPLIIKADTAGSLEAITQEVNSLTRERMAPKIVLSGIGKINENDVKSALSTTGAVIIGFHTKIDPQAAALAERSGIDVLFYNVIYELTEKVGSLLEEREPKIQVEEVKGKSKVLKTFGASKGKQVIGARVIEGSLDNAANFRIIRRESEIGRGKIKGLQQAKVEVDSVLEGNECGAMIESKVDISPGDILEAVVMVTK